MESSVKVKMLVAQSCPTLCDLMDCNLPGSPVHGILQARMLEWVVICFMGSSQPRDWAWISCIASRFFTVWATREGQMENGSWLLSLSQKLIFSPASDGICSVLNVLALRIPLILHLWKKEIESENVRWRGRFHWGGWRCECDGCLLLGSG